MAVAVVSATIGYWVGVGSSLNITNSTPQHSPAASEKGVNSGSDESDDETNADGNLGDVKAGMMEECKLVSAHSGPVISTNITPTIGACRSHRSWNVQRENCRSMRVSLRDSTSWPVLMIRVRHATLACYKALSAANPTLLRHWERIGQAKIALKCNSEEELLLLQATAQSLNLCARSIQDAYVFASCF